jgi:uncharacterized protein YukE
VPFLLPDPAELRALATRIDDAASAARDRGSRLGAAVAGTGWRGPAATAFDAQAGTAIGALRGAGGRLAEAADALRRHADAVEAEVDVLTGIVRAGLATLPELLDLPGDVLGGLGREVDGLVTTAGDVAGHIAGSVAGHIAGGVLGLVGR